jgi:hypothetical protein
LLSSGRVSTREVQDFKVFIKRELRDRKGGVGKDQSAIGFVDEIIHGAYKRYIEYKLDKIKDTQKKRAARVQKILDRAEERRKKKGFK